MTAGYAPVLVAASHGTSDPLGQRAVKALVLAVSQARPQLRVLGSYVDVQQPDVPASLDALADEPEVVIVPLLLSAGYHVRVDLARAASDAMPTAVRVTGALGPDARLTAILGSRLAEAGLRPGDCVVLAAASSSDANAVDDCHLVGRQLAELLGREVTVGFISAALPRLSSAVASARAGSPGQRVVISSYLLAPGYFAGLAHTAGADVVSAPLLVAGQQPPPGLVNTVIDRYEGAASSL